MSVQYLVGHFIHAALPYLQNRKRDDSPLNHSEIRDYLGQGPWNKDSFGEISSREWRRIYAAWDYLAELLNLAESYTAHVSHAGYNADLVVLHGGIIYVIEVKCNSRHNPKILWKAKKQIASTIKALNRKPHSYVIHGYCLQFNTNPKKRFKAKWIPIHLPR